MDGDSVLWAVMEDGEWVFLAVLAMAAVVAGDHVWGVLSGVAATMVMKAILEEDDCV